MNEYQKAVQKLDLYNEPCVNMPLKHHQFRMMAQENSETVDQFIVMLTRQAENCDFGSTMMQRYPREAGYKSLLQVQQMLRDGTSH